MKELDLIELIKNSIDSTNSIGDDCAYIEDLRLLLTTDMLVEDVHFRLSSTTPFDLGYKSMAVNLSDIAAAGGIAKFALISLSLPKYIDEAFVEEFYDGLKEISTRYGVSIVGGDVAGGEKLVVNITLLGSPDGIIPAKRSTAGEEQIVIATGFFGSSAAGLWILENPDTIAQQKELPEFIFDKFKRIHNRPEPQMGFGRIIAQNSQPLPCMMDTSDGLADALFKISQASRVDIEIDMEFVPIDADLKIISDMANVDINKWILFAGEDYQLVACVNEKTAEKLAQKNIPIRKIGKTGKKTNSPTVIVKQGDKNFIIDKNAVETGCFSHF
ncbi:MAG: thiamine-phosphate kinase [Candidatus Gastranaerophilales bacterium]|nr:thiamine-phosphate kinase [Candidatus Gastranaerophilales bacterium]